MRLFLFLVCLMSFSFCHARDSGLLVVDDQDGYVNVRSSNKVVKDNVVDKLENGFLLSSFESRVNWTLVFYEKNQKPFQGFIYSDRLKSISGFMNIPIKNQAENEVILSNGNIEITISQGDFDEKKHVITPFEGNLVHKIDGKVIWGVDGNIPRKEYENITVRIGESILELPREAVSNVYEPHLSNTSASYNDKTQTLYIQSSNSDGAGGYVVVWIVEKGKYKNRVVE